MRGIGAAIALPWLEAMEAPRVLAGGVGQTGAPPLRMAFFYVPTACTCPTGRPSNGCRIYDAGHTSTARHRFETSCSSSRDWPSAMARRSATVPAITHARWASFLTGVHPLKTDGAGIRVGISADQVAAQKIGSQTRLPSLELGIERGAQSGNCDSGYSCAYSSNISWRSANMPMAKEINPKLVLRPAFRIGASRRNTGPARPA